MSSQQIKGLGPHRILFLDETRTTTKMTGLRGRSLKAQRLLSKAPFGLWKMQTLGDKCSRHDWQSWLRESEQSVEWIFCLTAARVLVANQEQR